MKLHREGRSIILSSSFLLVALLAADYFLYQSTNWIWIPLLIGATLFVFYYLIVQFFRIPNRTFSFEEMDVLCPADGKIVVIEEVFEPEYFKEKRIQVSIFMSPMNVHANYHPISGIVQYVKYHPGLFLVAWHPKSSTDNERTTVVTKHASGQEVLFRQIAGAVARRICYYAKESQEIKAGDEFGFIKFGSRVDVFLPLNCEINVKIGDIVKSRVTKIGKLN